MSRGTPTDWLAPDHEYDQGKLAEFLLRLPPVVAELRASHAVAAQAKSPPPPGFPALESEDEHVVVGLNARWRSLIGGSVDQSSVSGAPNVLTHADWDRLKELIG